MACIEASLARLDRVTVETARLDRVSAALARLDGVTADVNLVCYVGGILYLRVSPAELQWVTEEMAAVYSVESNTTWNVQ